MPTTTTVPVPDIGDFEDVPVIEVLVAVGDTVAAEDSLVVLESDKATMEVPSPSAGTVKEVLVAVGDKVKEGVPLVTLEVDEGSGSSPAAPPASGSGTSPSGASLSAPPVDSDSPPEDIPAPPASASATPTPAYGGDLEATKPPPHPGKLEEVELPSADHSAQLVVLGAGPGGYTAAFRAADLGMDVLLIEGYERLGGVCLNVGCIPSKALLHTAKLITDAEASGAHGVAFAKPEIDIDKVREHKDAVVTKLVSGLSGMAKQRKVRVVHGTAQFTGAHTMSVQTPDGEQSIAFQQCIIAAGSQSVALPELPDDPRIMDSTGALELPDVPARLLIVGGGIIGLEMATVYDALGSAVTVVELADVLMPGADQDLVRPLAKRIKGRYAGVHLGTRVEAIEAADDGLHVRFAGQDIPAGDGVFDRVIVAVGRRPNGGALNADAAGVEVDTRGVIPVDARMRTNVPHISAIGDLVPGPMLAHKALHEAKVAAEVCAGEDVIFDAKTIPSVAYTDPEVAWTGLTELEAKAQGVEVEVHTFPWAASGRALAMDRGEGATKLVVEPGTHRILGAGAVGVHAGDLITEATLAIEMGAVAGDLALTIHPHPTLSETFGLAGDLVEGTITDLPQPRKRKPR